MNECSPKMLQDALKVYKDKFGSTKDIDMFELEEIIDSLKQKDSKAKRKGKK